MIVRSLGTDPEQAFGLRICTNDAALMSAEHDGLPCCRFISWVDLICMVGWEHQIRIACGRELSVLNVLPDDSSQRGLKTKKQGACRSQHRTINIPNSPHVNCQINSSAADTCLLWDSFLVKLKNTRWTLREIPHEVISFLLSNRYFTCKSLNRWIDVLRGEHEIITTKRLPYCQPSDPQQQELSSLCLQYEFCDTLQTRDGENNGETCSHQNILLRPSRLRSLTNIPTRRSRISRHTIISLGLPTNIRSNSSKRESRSPWTTLPRNPAQDSIRFILEWNSDLFGHHSALGSNNMHTFPCSEK